MYRKPRYYRRRNRGKRGVILQCCIVLLIPALVLILSGFVLLRDEGFPDAGIQLSPSTALRDTEPPSVTGLRNFTVYEGDTITYRSGITVVDNTDPLPQLLVDSSQVDLAVSGTYEVIYHAVDASGNQSAWTVSVTVLPKQEGYQDLDTIYKTADDLLTTLITSDMTAHVKVQTVYEWARSNIAYFGHSDRSDWRQTAYTVLTERSGDCYGYYSVTKLLFERLGIPNIDVQKVRNSADDSDHFWSMVSVDGGNSYYHFDATPRIGDGDDFCLVTDAFLDTYSEEHDGSHNRDRSLYPETPEEAL